MGLRTSLEEVLDYLKYSVMQRYVVPQMVWIDSQRRYPVANPPDGRGQQRCTPESYWRNMIETLLKEPAERRGQEDALTHHRHQRPKKAPST